jgi:hypothetical protein
MAMTIKMLCGCARCERRIYDGEKTLKFVGVVPVDESEIEHVTVCGKCHSKWLTERLCGE